MKKYSILIVDDEENVSKLLKKIFIKEGYRAHTAASGVEALNIIDSNEIDVIITDIKMPGISGIELLKKVNEIDPSILFIIITAFATLDTAIEALRMGAKDYITKPFDLEEIISSVKKILANKEEQYISSYEVENQFKSSSPKMLEVIKMIEHIADTKATVIIYGGTGTGKELAAKALHNFSARRDKPFIKVNCAAIPDALLESELFGYEKGAFTGAVVKKPGKFELANGGTIFLDEIGDISPQVQVKLLRVIQEREIEHLGGLNTLKIDVRLITATNKNLEDLVKEGKFREDLYYRLNVVPVKMPSLNERKEDIPMLVDDFLKESAVISGKKQKHITDDALKVLTNYIWPGNIRELENVIERCVVITSGETIKKEDLPAYITSYSNVENSDSNILDNALDETEKNVIVDALRKCSGNRTKASEVLGISRRSLHRKIAKYSIED